MSFLNETFGVGRVTDASHKTNTLINSSLKTGIELEVEGMINLNGRPTRWDVKADGSLRNAGVEYVLEVPLSGSILEKAVNNLQQQLEAEIKSGNRPTYNWRTSLHVHLNFSDKLHSDLFSMFVHLILFERILLNYCGPERADNIFCIPYHKNKIAFNGVKDYFATGKWRMSEDWKYTSFNINSMRQFGTVEVRVRQGTHNAEEIFEWLNILYSIYNESQRAKNGKYLLMLHEEVSRRGIYNYGERVFGRLWTRLTHRMIRSEVERELLRGVRQIQPLLFDTRKSTLLGDL